MEFKTYVLKNNAGMEVHVTNFGGIISKVLTHDKKGKLGDVVLGFDQTEDYKDNPDHPYFGALIGRFSNRIANGKFTLDGRGYQLTVNNGLNHLHGGTSGFDKVFWESKQEGNKLELSYLSEDGEEGYPGNLKTLVTYELSEWGEIKITYGIETDKATPINLTQHSYFNLTGDPSKKVLDHIICIYADDITEVDKNLIPTGKLKEVSGTPMDLTKPKRIGQEIEKVEGGGFDHNWVLRGKNGEMKLAATLHDPESGRFMEVHTSEPGLQFYSGNFLDGKLKGKNGYKYLKNAGLCLETQHFPDSPNHPNFPSTILRPGNKYTSTTLYKFSVK